MSVHSWCSNPARDEAVRAAEDAAAAERTTLPDHRDLSQAVAELRRRVEQLEACACAGLLQGLGDDPPNDFTKTARIREGETAVEPVIPAANAHGGGGGGLRTERVTECRPVDAGGGGNVTPGLRTERVTLEVTHDCKYPAAEWVLDIVREACSDPGESVRVVEEAKGGMTYEQIDTANGHLSDMVKSLTDERDAAIREREEWRRSFVHSEEAGTRLLAERDAALDEADGLRACVAETDVRFDDAIRKLNKLRAERITQALTADRFAVAVAEADRLRARVAELESERDSAIRERDELLTECERLRESVRVAARNRTFWHQQCALRETRAKELEARVAELEAAPAASGWRMLKVGETVEPGDEMTDDLFMPWCDAGPCVGKQVVSGVIAYRRRVPAPDASGAANSPESPKSSEPDAWGVIRDGSVESVAHRRFRNNAEHSAEHLGGTVVPLYTAPPPARGWLKEEEREAVHVMALVCDRTVDAPRANILRALLARSSPPEVVAPAHRGAPEIRQRDSLWRNALAAAGVKVKEEGRE